MEEYRISEDMIDEVKCMVCGWIPQLQHTFESAPNPEMPALRCFKFVCTCGNPEGCKGEYYTTLDEAMACWQARRHGIPRTWLQEEIDRREHQRAARMRYAEFQNERMTIPGLDNPDEISARTLDLEMLLMRVHELENHAHLRHIHDWHAGLGSCVWWKSAHVEGGTPYADPVYVGRPTDATWDKELEFFVQVSCMNLISKNEGRPQ